MRIAYLINQYPKITHTFIRREIEAIERQGIEIVRFSLRGWDLELTAREDRVERERTQYVLRGGAGPLIAALTRMMLTQPLVLMRALVLALRMGRRSERSFLVHLVYLAEACVIVRWMRQADVQHLHAHFASNPAEVAMLAHALGGPRWSFTAHGAASLENPNSHGLLEKAKRCAFSVAVCSFGRAQFLRFMHRRDWSKVKIIRCGLEATFYKGNLSPFCAARRFVCVSRLSSEKAHLLLLESVQQLVANGTDFELVLAGDGELRSDIEAAIARHHLEGRVHIKGWIDTDQVKNEILSARALLLPSLIEGLPLVLVEAMSLRRPVISTFVAGIPELVIPGENGWLVPPGDVEALARAMQHCLDASDDTLARMGEAAQRRIMERHDVDLEAAKLAKLFRDVISG